MFLPWEDREGRGTASEGGMKAKGGIQLANVDRLSLTFAMKQTDTWPFFFFFYGDLPDCSPMGLASSPEASRTIGHYIIGKVLQTHRNVPNGLMCFFSKYYISSFMR